MRVAVGAKMVSGPGDITVMEHEDVEVTCLFMGSPQPTVSWYKAGIDLQLDKTYEIETKLDITTLHIKDAKVEDTAEYTLKLRNDSGEDTYSVNVIVTGNCRVRFLYVTELVFTGLAPVS